jgi:hypothetical protein
MQRLFEGKKTAYSPSDLNMESTRLRSLINSIILFFSIQFSILAEEMILTYETAKKKCFFDSEQVVVRIQIPIKYLHYFFFFYL